MVTRYAERGSMLIYGHFAFVNRFFLPVEQLADPWLRDPYSLFPFLGMVSGIASTDMASGGSKRSPSSVRPSERGPHGRWDEIGQRSSPDARR
ncbi:hypothetical protein BK133_17425 [Paenibacillus sp. FSL H8-0548]|uniref:hypothetical protein n=1 Tax=Paenibacillus sp. FSL H8-0548 TaxID=1920422 RepID=UPI00096DBB0E|nr:hypothetical protein [Paenibacillus sp. FSL H8-0548]OMF29780.1 hypothetical protein BK133_17425 [Paenibacillus sp. FSL H8-0548]